MTATTIEAIKKASNRRGNVRKGLNVVVFMAPASVEVPAAITEGTGQLTQLSGDWLPVGLMTKDGIKMTTDVSKEEVEALGYLEPVRTDVVKAPRTVTLTVLETLRKNLQSLVYGVDLSQVKANKNTGEITFDETPLPAFDEWRLLAVMADGPATNEWLVGRCFPSVKLGKIPEETWAPSDPVKFDLEFDVFTDEILGTPCRHYIGGTGTLKALDAIGFEKAA